MQAGAGSDKEMEMSEIIRLDKYLADMGCGTRSQVKQMIRKGQVEINGEKIKKPEQKITTAQDRVCVAGTEIRYEKYRYYLLHKPAGYSGNFPASLSPYRIVLPYSPVHPP